MSNLITKKFALLLLSPFLLTSCITPGQKKAMQQDISQLQDELAKLQANITAQFKLMAKNTKVAFTSQSNVETLQNQINESQGEIDSLKTQLKKTEDINSSITASNSKLMSDNQKTIDQLQRQIAKLENQLAEQKSSVKTSTNSAQQKAPFKPKNAAELTKSLKRDYENSKFKDVIEKSDAVLNSTKTNKNISAEMLEIALQFRGEAQFELKNYQAATVDLANLVEQYPNAKRKARALLLLGDGYVYLKRQSPALSYYNECATSFSNTSEGTACAERITKLSQ